MNKTYRIALNVLEKYGNLTQLAAAAEKLPEKYEDKDAGRKAKYAARNRLKNALIKGDELYLHKVRNVLSETHFIIVLMSDQAIREYK